MTVCKKIFAVSLACALLAANVYAQDDWGSDESSVEETSEPTFWDRFKISGDANLAGRAYVGKYVENKAVEGADTPVYAIPKLKLGFDYEGNATKFSSKLRFDEQTLRYDNEMILDEFSADLFVGNWVLSAGKMKVVWGKGDKLHVLDNFNSNNYYDFLVPDYLDRRNSEYMFRAQYNSPLGFRFEAIYTPIMHGDTYASKGPWKPSKVDTLTKKVTAIKTSQALYAAGCGFNEDSLTPHTNIRYGTDGGSNFWINYGNGSLNQKSLGVLSQVSSFSADDLYPNTNSLRYGQFGGYFNFTLGLFDFGVSYYNGRYKSVSANGQAYADSQANIGAALQAYSGYMQAYAKYTAAGQAAAAAAALASAQAALDNGPKYYGDITLKYDELQSFGLDMQTALGPFTIRAEGVYNMTKDFDGSDPWTRNNSIGYLFGFDVGLPIHNVTLNVQGTGTYILGGTSNVKAFIKGYGYKEIAGSYTNDVDYDPAGYHTNHKIVMQLQDTFYYEKITATVKAIYGIEHYDLIVMPELSFKVRDGWKASASGMIIHCFDKNEYSEFYGWLDNSFVQLAVNYTF